MFGVNERMGLKLFGREVIFEEFKPIWTRYLIVMDARTDRRTTYRRITALCASIARYKCYVGSGRSQKTFVWRNI